MLDLVYYLQLVLQRDRENCSPLAWLCEVVTMILRSKLGTTDSSDTYARARPVWSNVKQWCAPEEVAESWPRAHGDSFQVQDVVGTVTAASTGGGTMLAVQIRLCHCT